MKSPRSLHQQLLGQARDLAKRDPGRPKQVNLRRSVSAAYYSLFHFLIDEACRTWLGTGEESRAMRAALARSFRHQDMSAVSRAIRGAQPKDSVFRLALGNAPIPPDLIELATTFSELQDARHQADYDLAARFRRRSVLARIEVVETAFKNWDQLRNDPAARLYLLSLLFWDRLKGSPR